MDGWKARMVGHDDWKAKVTNEHLAEIVGAIDLPGRLLPGMVWTGLATRYADVGPDAAERHMVFKPPPDLWPERSR